VPENPSTDGTVSAGSIAALLRRGRRIAVLTGAGMSAESGIPTFRGERNGLWARFDPMTLATPQAYREDPALVWGWYRWRMALVAQARPNAGHVAIARLQELADVAVVTQNVDDLHERAGTRGVVHLHGSLFATRCLLCDRRHAQVAFEQSMALQPTLKVEPPACEHCGGPVRPGVVWFGEPLPQAAWQDAVDVVTGCDAMLVVGTSGVVHPAAGLPELARQRGRPVIEINPEETAISALAEASWRVSAAAGLSALLERLTAQ
jgi:NAD-dependent deacetylase